MIKINKIVYKVDNIQLLHFIVDHISLKNEYDQEKKEISFFLKENNFFEQLDDLKFDLKNITKKWYEYISLFGDKELY